jgi:excisionase family DNA binding protein
MSLGLGLGLPLGLVIAIVVTRQATQPSEATRLTRRLQGVGIGIAVAGISSTNIYLLGFLTFAPDLQFRALGIAAQIPNGMIAVAEAAFIGRECGYRLAGRHLRRFGQEPRRRVPDDIGSRRPLMDLPTVAEQLGVNERHIRRPVHERRIPFVKWGHLLRFDPDEIDG